MKRTISILILVLAAIVIFIIHFNTTDNSKNGVIVTKSRLVTPALVGNIPCKFPLVKDDTSMNVIITGYGDVNVDDVYVWKKYEEMTGVDVVWTTVTKSERREAVYAALSNKIKLDLIMRCKVSADNLVKYGNNGLILDLAKDNMLQKYAPNCWAYLQSHHDALASVMNPDGTIYALPQVNSGAELRVSRKIFVNKKWLKNVKMDIPTTTEEFYLLLKAFKNQDANKNGDKNDEIPLCSADWSSIEEAFWGAFGLANRGIHNQTIDCDEKTGKARLIRTTDDYKNYLEYFNRLYSEKLLDNSIFTMTTKQWLNSIENDRIGVFVSTNLASLPAGMTDNWIAIEEPLQGPNGDKMWAAIRANFHSTGAAIIPATCENPELVLRWLDYFWTDEGTLFYHMGIENETFTANNQNVYDYTPAIYEEMRTANKSFDDVVARYSPYPGGNNPTVEIAPYFKGGEVADIPAKAAKKLFEYGPVEYWPSFTFTAEENERLITLESDITKYCSLKKIDFISGTTPFSEWNEYLAQLNLFNQPELLEIYQTAVDRYYAINSESN